MNNGYENTIRIAHMIRQQRPAAQACIYGYRAYPNLHGMALFYHFSGGVLVVAEIFGLPQISGTYNYPIFAFHIHEGRSCNNPGPHYNPDNLAHPYHAGDLPPLFSNGGYAWQAFITNRFTVNEIIDRTIVIHRNPDDFRTQPSGDAGEMIACGEILPI